MFRKTLCAAALLGMLAPVSANANAGGNSAEVRYGDLDLTSPNGRTRLDTRVRAAAKKVCEADYAFSLDMRMAANACVGVALASAKPQVARAFAAADERVARAGAGIDVEASAVSDS